MKILLLVLATSFVISVNAQQIDGFQKTLSTTIYSHDTASMTNAIYNPYYISKSIRFMGAEINNEYMIIDSAGNLYYKPSAFCKCDTANKMVFLLNIFHPEIINHEPKH